MNSSVNSLIALAVGAAWVVICTLALRSDRYMQQMLESVLRSYRRPVTADAIAQMVPWAKTALIISIVMGVAIAALGAITLVIGPITIR